MRTISTYDRFHRHILAWVAEEIMCLVVLGKPGFGKSWIVRTALGDRSYHLFSARQTPIQVYNTLYDHPDLPVVFDDVSSLLRDGNFIDMLKNLCEDGPATIRWGTTTEKLEGRAKEFECTSPVLILLNKLPDNNPDVRAILDRCDNILFEPTKVEVIQYMRKHFPADDELIDLLAMLPTLPTIRTLEKAQKWDRASHLNLEEELLAECGVSDEIIRLVQIMATYPEAEWCRRYVESTGHTDRTYRRVKKVAEQILTCRASTRTRPNGQPSAPRLAAG